MTERRGRHSNRFLLFALGNEDYGIRIENVMEIIPLLPITRVPRTPPVVLGVVNLRGKIVPVFDLRRSIGLAPEEPRPSSCIIVLCAGGANASVVVDSVREVALLAEDQIQPPPDFGADVSTAHLLGVSTKNNQTRLLIDVDRWFLQGELASMSPDSEALGRVA